ncbi:alpha/beta fold hydrolase [candidate division KSB1 bacterium]|nr:alpha/beta fold hydrolase [candidate division KSB1 bacterium]
MTLKICCCMLLIIPLAIQTLAQSGNDALKQGEPAMKRILDFLPPEKPDRGRVSPLDATWKDWLERTGEMPPDFSRMPALPLLPDPLVLDEGGANIPVKSTKQWRQKKEWIRDQLQHWITGAFPPPPDKFDVRLLDEKKDGDVILRTVELIFAPPKKLGEKWMTPRLTIELLIPPGKGPFPAFMTQWNHREWAMIALRRGYIGCVYAGADAKDDTEVYADIWYPQYDFTCLMRRAWGAHRAVDYLYTLPIVDKAKIAITGHSRNGKQSLMAAAFDERITAVISSSGGTGAEDPFRYTSDKFDNETIADITTNFPHWLHPRLRFFVGNEHKLPVDQNSLMSLIAPRGLMLVSAITEHQGNPWGIEQAYRSAGQVYRFLGAEDKLAIWLRRGRHGTAARDIETFIDFFDFVFGRDNIQPPCKLYYDYTFDDWRTLSGETIDPLAYPVYAAGSNINPVSGTRENASLEGDAPEKEIIRRIHWLLGEEPPGATNAGPLSFANRRKIDDYLGEVIIRPAENKNMGIMTIGPYHAFGDYLYGNLYYPREADFEIPGSHLPVVIFLHEYAYPTGYARRIQPFFEKLVQHGFAVFAFDMLGFGTRIEEGTYFYQRYPHWSKMGKMVADVRAAVEALANLEFIDAGRIYTVGYSLGGTVGLFAGALDDRIAATAAVCGFTPLRSAMPASGIEGVMAYSHLHGLLPRSGFFIGYENRLPIDFPEIIACLAPRPLQVIAPQFDRDAIFEDVTRCMEYVRDRYAAQHAEKNLAFQTPIDYNRFSEKSQDAVVNWLVSLGI